MPDARPSPEHTPKPSEYTGGYNYAIFRGEEDFDAFMGVPHAGDRAPDATLTDLDSNQISLASLWRTNNLLLEFGSYT